MKNGKGMELGNIEVDEKGTNGEENQAFRLFIFNFQPLFLHNPPFPVPLPSFTSRSTFPFTLFPSPRGKKELYTPYPSIRD